LSHVPANASIYAFALTMLHEGRAQQTAKRLLAITRGEIVSTFHFGTGFARALLQDFRTPPAQHGPMHRTYHWHRQRGNLGLKVKRTGRLDRLVQFADIGARHEKAPHTGQHYRIDVARQNSALQFQMQMSAK
jgi:hypothetical protein